MWKWHKDRESNQSQLVYSWESRFPDTSHSYLSLQQCQDHVNSVWEDLKITFAPPTVTDGRGSCAARFYEHRIMLPRWARNLTILCHEISHGIVDLFSYHDSMDHGGMFLHTYITILGRYAGYRYTDLKYSALDYGLNLNGIKLRCKLKQARCLRYK